MSNTIPPLVSSSPPPIIGPLDEEDDEFGDFAAATDLSYGCDGLSVPSSPSEINNESIENTVDEVVINKIEKDFQDRRKTDLENICDKVGESNIDTKTNVNNVEYNTSKINLNTECKYNSFQYIPEIPPDILPENSDVDNDEFINDLDIDRINIVSEDAFIEKPSLKIELEDNAVVEDDSQECNKPSYSKNDIEISESLNNYSIELPEEQIFESLGNSPVACEPDDKSDNTDEFNDFEDCKPESSFKNTNPDLDLTIDSEGSDFGDFTNNYVEDTKENNHQSIFNNDAVGQIEEETCKENKIEEFGDFDNYDFGDFTGPSFSSVLESELTIKSSGIEAIDGEEDEFGDFNDYSLQTQISQESQETIGGVLSLNYEDIPEKAKNIILEMFVIMEQSTEEYSEQDFTQTDPVFNALKDVTDTNALLYQWNKSRSQNSLLQSLNIDTRNILYGPRWNESMPRYAATLGYTPLEPMKSTDLLTPTLVESSSQIPSSSSTQAEIPSAQFDWVGSGLTNPLENSPTSTMLLDLEQLVATLDIQYTSSLSPKSQKSSSSNDNLDDWEFWLKTTPKTTPNPESEIKEEKPTDINKNISIETKSTLESEPNSIVQIKQKDNESVKSLQLEEVSEKIESNAFSSFPIEKTIESGGFTEWTFNNSVPLRETHISNINNSNNHKTAVGFDEPGWLKPTILTPDLPRKQSKTSDDIQIELKPDENEITQATINQTVNNDLRTEVEEKIEVSVEEEDEFTDFQSTLPIQPVAFVEPLKPAVLEPVICSTAPTTINWPDPGVSDDDLRNFELFYKPNVETTAIVREGPSKPAEDDEWSDFVSSEPSNKALNQVKQPSRTSTPELQLSVPHLNQIQPPKKPIPIITQQGLMQTRLPSTLPITLPPAVPQITTYPQNGFQPSLISTQFASFGCSNAGINYNEPLTEIGLNKQPRHDSQLGTIKVSSYIAPRVASQEENDEEWTDFVSSQPAASVISNGVHKHTVPKPNFDWNGPPQFTSWSTSVTPNIITNPASFDSFQSFSGHSSDLSRTKPRKSTQQKNSIASISTLPDLEFIAPKNKTWKK